MAAYSNERVAAIVISVLYRMLTVKFTHKKNCVSKVNNIFLC